jgi:glycosyltransferase involved in cell wall biosynthesis
VYYQAMLVGISKKSLIHTWRFNRLDRWVTLLPFLEEQVLERTRVKSTLTQVIPLGTPTPLPSEKTKEELRKELKLEPNNDWIGIVGRLDRQKGQLDALHALALLRGEYGMNVGLAFIGEPTKNEGEAYLQELQEYIQANQLHDSVVFCGHRANPTTYLPAFIQLWVPSWNETYGTVTIEGMASEVPTLGANSAGTAALINNTDALFEPKNPASIAAVSFSVYVNSGKKEAILAHQQAEFKRLYSKEASLTQWMNLLMDLKSQK